MTFVKLFILFFYLRRESCVVLSRTGPFLLYFLSVLLDTSFFNFIITIGFL